MPCRTAAPFWGQITSKFEWFVPKNERAVLKGVRLFGLRTFWGKKTSDTYEKNDRIIPGRPQLIASLRYAHICTKYMYVCINGSFFFVCPCQSHFDVSQASACLSFSAICCRTVAPTVPREPGMYCRYRGRLSQVYEYVRICKKFRRGFRVEVFSVPSTVFLRKKSVFFFLQ